MTGTRFKPYPETKDSGIEWLGLIPDHWDTRRLKHTAALRNEKASSDSDTPYIGMENVESWTGKTVETDLAVDGLSDVFYHGDVLFGKLRPYLAKALLATETGQCSSEFFVLKPIEFSGLFLRDLVLSRGFIDAVDAETYGTKMPRANWETVGGMRVPVPSHEEQEAIADFLDRETAKIDGLVEKKVRLIELLREKRTALITHAVTKGLDPNVPMKDSGIEWLGRIPAHWESIRVKNVATMRAGVGITSEAIEEAGEYPVYGGNGLRGYTSSFTHVGDVVLIGRQGALCGNVNYASGEFWASEHAVVVEPLGGTNVHWLGETLRSMKLNDYSVAAAQPGLAVDRILALSIAVPTKDEQRQIADSLDHESAKIDALIAKIREAIERLKEYRTALISAVVTGKIDVRNKEPFEAVDES